MTKAGKNLARDRSMMAPDNPVPPGAYSASCDDQLGVATLQRILSDAAEPSGKRAGQARTQTPGRPVRLASGGRLRFDRVPASGARRWLVPAAAACAVAAI